MMLDEMKAELANLQKEHDGLWERLGEVNRATSALQMKIMQLEQLDINFELGDPCWGIDKLIQHIEDRNYIYDNDPYIPPHAFCERTVYIGDVDGGGYVVLKSDKEAGGCCVVGIPVSLAIECRTAFLQRVGVNDAR